MLVHLIAIKVTLREYLLWVLGQSLALEIITKLR
jgi:hypothetical protein